MKFRPFHFIDDLYINCMIKSPDASERISSSKVLDEDNDISAYVRESYPFHLDEFIGNERAVSYAKETLDNDNIHTIFYGPPGVGKSLLCELIAVERRANLIQIEGGNLTVQGFDDLVIDQVTDNTVFFIDEIHRMPARVEEHLYSPIERKVLHQLVPRINVEVSISFAHKHVKFLGATTLEGDIHEPLRQRMQTIRMSRYTDQELYAMIQAMFHITNDATRVIVANSEGTPRVAKELCLMISHRSSKIITIDDVQRALYYDERIHNTTYNQRRYLVALYQDMDHVMGQRYLQSLLNVSRNELLNVIEPSLIDKGFVSICPRGRELTSKGINFVLKYRLC